MLSKPTQLVIVPYTPRDLSSFPIPQTLNQSPTFEGLLRLRSFCNKPSMLAILTITPKIDVPAIWVSGWSLISSFRFGILFGFRV